MNIKCDVKEMEMQARNWYVNKYEKVIMFPEIGNRVINQ